jgi:hypothetical protein
MPRTYVEFIAFVVLVFLCQIALAQDIARREAAIDKLIQVQVNRAGVALDDNAMNAVLVRFRAANPSAPEQTWPEIRSLLRASFLRAISDRKGAFALAVREIMPQFTTEEIEKLAAIHNDPLFLRYTDAAFTALKSPATEFAIRIAIESTIVEINELLIQRGLKPSY